MIKILVTGASGFIGKHLIPQLLAVGHNVFEASGQSGDVASESTWLKFPQAEVVIHLAGKTFVPESWADPTAFIKCNLLGTVAALNYCKKYNARLIFLSSYLYGNPQTLPIPETAPLIINNPYALSKKLAEEVCHFYSDMFRINIIILRPFNVYGPGQPEYFLIPSIIRQIIAGKVIQVKDLEPRRDYVYISDLVDVIVKAVEVNNINNIFNVGSGVSHSVAELIRVIQDILQTNIPVRSSEEIRKNEIMDTVADITMINKVLKWSPKWTLIAGINKILSEF